MPVNECLSAVQHDHSDIRTMLGVLEATVNRISRGERTDPAMVAGVTRFFEQFAAYHDEKEQQLLLPAVEPLWPAAERRAIRRLLWNFSRSRRLLLKLVPLLRAVGGETADPIRLAAVATEYAAHLRMQLQEEERWFVSLLRDLTTDDDAKLARGFKRLERQRIGPTGREWYNQLVADYRDIVATWAAVPPSTLTP